MGAIKGLIDGFDQSAPATAEQQELIQRLADLAQAKAAYFESELKNSLQNAGQGDNHTIPIEAVLNSTTQTHAYSSSKVDKIGDTVTSALKSFCGGSSGSVIDGVGQLLTGALTTFLGEGDSEDGQTREYYVLVENLAVVRVDVLAWYRTVHASSIRTHAEKVSAFVAVKSAVDLSKIGFNSFLAIYGNQLTLGGTPNREVKAELESAREVYEQFHSRVPIG